MKKFVKDAIGDFRVLLDHSYRDYEVSPPHILKRIVLPFCEDITKVLEKGTKNDAQQVLEGFAAECGKAARKWRDHDHGV